MPVNYDSIIDKLSEDPEFLDLNPDEQDQLVQELAQEKMGVIPKSGNLLERAMKISQGFTEGFADASTMGGTWLARQGAEKMVPLSPEAESKYQEITDVNPLAKGVGAAIPIGKGIFDLGKLGAKGINALRTSPIKKEIKSVEDLIMKSKQAEAPIREELKGISESARTAKQVGIKKAENVAYEGSKAVKEQVTGRFRDANKRFGEEFLKLDSRMGDEDIAKVIKNAANDIGAPDIVGSPGNVLMGQLKKFGPKVQEGIEQLEAKIYNKEQVQAITKEILDSLPDDRSKAIFHKHLIDALPDSIPGLKELKASHAPIYKIAKDAKGITKGALKRVARGTASEAELNDLGKAGERLGTSHVERARKVAKQNDLERMMFDQKKAGAQKRLSAKGEEQEFLKSKLPELERKIGDVRFRQAVTGAGASALGIGGLLSKLFGVDRSQ